MGFLKINIKVCKSYRKYLYDIILQKSITEYMKDLIEFPKFPLIWPENVGKIAKKIIQQTISDILYIYI